jgi:hypothetical protein
MVILAVIFPKAHFADFVSGAFAKSFVATTGASVGLLAFLRLGHVFKHTRSLHQPTRKVSVNAVIGEVESAKGTLPVTRQTRTCAARRPNVLETNYTVDDVRPTFPVSNF